MPTKGLPGQDGNTGPVNAAEGLSAEVEGWGVGVARGLTLS